MANIRIKAALARIESELQSVAKHAQMYSGVDEKDALMIDNDATAIAIAATQLAVMARKARGQPAKSADAVVKKVRKALGFTHP